MSPPKSQAALSQRICFAKDIGLNSSENSVLLCLSMHGDAFGMNIYPSINTLAAECCLSARTVKTAIKSLIAKDYIAIKEQGGIVNGVHKSNHYFIDIRKFGYTYK